MSPYDLAIHSTNRRRRFSAFAACVWFLAALCACPGPSAEGEGGARVPSSAAERQARAAGTGRGSYLVYVGTYTRGESRGIYVFEFDAASGGASSPRLAAEAENPSFLALHPRRNILYAVNETQRFEGRASGGVSAFALADSGGALRLLNRRPSGGGAPCHLSLDSRGRYLFVANYTGGSVAVLEVAEDGTLKGPIQVAAHEGSGPNRRRQEKPHAHWVGPDPQDRHVLAADLGIDQVVVYRLKPGPKHIERIGAGVVPPGSGPRHAAFHPSGRTVYVINELSSTLTAFRYDPERGTLERRGTLSTLPAGVSVRNTTAEVAAHPSGRFVYGSNRGHDSIVTFKVGEAEDELEPLAWTPSGGRTPRNFALDPRGRWLLAANQDSNNVVFFRIESDGVPKPADRIVEVPAPVCVLFVSRN